MTFDDIPLSVTLNEYVEIAKHYSTAKSGSFVNGLLDTITKKLVAEGKIKK
jgi:N utilization substance protein B